MTNAEKKMVVPRSDLLVSASLIEDVNDASTVKADGDGAENGRCR